MQRIEWDEISRVDTVLSQIKKEISGITAPDASDVHSDMQFIEDCVLGIDILSRASVNCLGKHVR